MSKALKRELRLCHFAGAEIRRASKDTRVLTGSAIVYNSESVDLGGFREVIAAGAFDAAVKDKRDILATFNHNVNQLLGRVASGTVRLKADTTGIHFEIDVPNTRNGDDLLELVDRGDVKGNSFTFTASEDRWDRLPDKTWKRTVLAGELYELGPVVSPAYDATTLAMRSVPPSDDETVKPPTGEQRTAPPADKPDPTLEYQNDEDELALILND